MAWFTTGLTNLKVQLNSLINEEDDACGGEIAMHVNSEATRKKSKELSRCDDSDFRDDFAESRLEFLSPEYVCDPHKRNVLLYCKRLSICSQEVAALNNCLNFLAQQFMNTVDAYDRLKNEITELKNMHSYTTTQNNENSLDSTSDSSVKQFSGNVVGERYFDHDIENVVINSEIESESDENLGIAYFTKQTENLLAAIDETKEKQRFSRKSLSEILIDTKVSKKLETILNEYFDYEELNDRIWQKLKILYTLPAAAKFKKTNISELSVPDSVKEAFQPNSSIVMLETPSYKRNSEIYERSEDFPSSTQSKNNAHFLDGGGAEECTRIQGKHSHTEELDRLRKHLLSVEQAYTNELLKCEQEIQVLQDQLNDNDKNLSLMTESYTCLNVRTNQTIETLQNETKKLAEENEKLKARLKDCEIELRKSSSETYNIRSALDLFYKNKDSEIFQATEKLRGNIEVAEHENRALRETIEHLRVPSFGEQKIIDVNNANLKQRDLEGSAEQLKQTSSLSNELKLKEEEISFLKNEVFRLQNELKNVDFKTGNTRLDAETAIKLNLIKNIVFRYITSDSSATRTQSLRILANVLEFSDHEKASIGLCGEMDENPPSESLIGEFIRFVEKESLPKRDQIFEMKDTKCLQNRVAPHSSLIHGLTNAASSAILKDVLHSGDNS